MTPTKKLIEQSHAYIMDTYRRLPVVLVRGKGTKVYDDRGKEYLDCVAGVAVNILGHCHPTVTAAIATQARRLMHVSNLYYSEPQIRLARLLVQHSFSSKVFFCNSGAEANEAAIKLTRKYARDVLGQDRHEIITTVGSFHGRTLATLSATGQEKLQKGFEPLVPGFRCVPFDDVRAVEKAVTPRTAAVLVEPIQGEGGVRVPHEDYLRYLRKLCDEKGLLLILDEVQTGMGRTGRLFAYEHYGVEPDIMTLAKGAANGFPIGMTLATEKVARAFVPGTHASTFGGNPLACSASLATFTTLLRGTPDSGLLAHCRHMGDYLTAGLRDLKGKYSFIKDIRGKGLLIGMELEMKGQPIVSACLTKGVIINCTAESVLRFVPPLIITRKEIDRLLTVLDKVFKHA